MTIQNRGYGICALVFGLCVGLALLAGSVSAQQSWVDEINLTPNFYKTSYPGSNWEPYSQRLQTVKEAVDRADTRTVKSEMGKWFKMLRAREQGIHERRCRRVVQLCVDGHADPGIRHHGSTGARRRHRAGLLSRCLDVSWCERRPL